MSTGTQLKTDFDLDVSDEPLQKAEPIVKKDEDGVPYCLKHHCRMKQTSGGKKGSLVAYFSCPVTGCEEKGKRVKSVKSIIPANPHSCPKCGAPAMERDERISTGFYTILKCPSCGHKSAPMARPEFVASHEKSRGVVAVESLGQR